MHEVRPFQIRAIFTDNLASVWDIWLHGDDYTAPELRRPVRIRVSSLIWDDELNDYRVGEVVDEIDEEKILGAPRCFHKVLQSLIDHSMEDGGHLP